MPELPEVETTVRGLRRTIVGKKITGVWTDLAKMKITRPDYRETIKYLPFFKKFEREVVGKNILSVERRAKNILIHISGGHTILIHMKMTGHLLFGEYAKKQDLKIKNSKLKIWTPIKPESLKDPYNRFIHFVFSLQGGKHLAFCDSRKFGKITLIPTKDAHATSHLKDLGPEPLAKDFTFEKFAARLKQKTRAPIKSVLLDQSVLAGVGNIYSDEALFDSGIHPLSPAGKIPKQKLRALHVSIKKVLSQGIDFGGDSMSDYRNVDGVGGKFQHEHNVYRKAGERCGKKNCAGVISRMFIGGRSAHFCPKHQEKYG